MTRTKRKKGATDVEVPGKDVPNEGGPKRATGFDTVSKWDRAESLESVKNYLKQFDVLVRRYNGVESAHGFCLKYGVAFEGAPLPDRIDRGIPKECFRNAALLVTSFKRKLIYCEGWGATPRVRIPIHHAWAVDAQGRVIDPTWDDPETCVYFGVPFDTEEMYRLIEESGSYGLLDNPSLCQMYTASELTERLTAAREKCFAERVKKDS